MRLLSSTVTILTLTLTRSTNAGLSFDNVTRLMAQFDQRSNTDTMLPRSLAPGKEIWVLFDMACQKLLAFDQTAGILKIHAWWRTYWTDASLLYNGTEWFGSMWESSKHFVTVKPGRFWEPDIIPFLSIDTDDEDTYRKTWAWVYDEQFLHTNGYNVFESKPAVINAHCNTNQMQKFPFDEHICTIEVGAWSAPSWVHRFGAKLRPGERTLPYSGEVSSEEWDVTIHEVKNVTRLYITGLYEEVHVSIKLKRFPHYFLVNIIFPMVLMVNLALLTYWIPINSDVGIERIPVQATLILTNVATILFTAEKRPMLQVNTWMDDFQSICIFLTFLPLLESCVMVWLKNHFDVYKNKSGRKRTRKMMQQVTSSSGPSTVSDGNGRVAFANALLFDSQSRRRAKSSRIMWYFGMTSHFINASWTLDDFDDAWAHLNIILVVVLFASCFYEVGWEVVFIWTRSQLLLSVPLLCFCLYMAGYAIFLIWLQLRHMQSRVAVVTIDTRPPSEQGDHCEEPSATLNQEYRRHDEDVRPSYGVACSSILSSVSAAPSSIAGFSWVTKDEEINQFDVHLDQCHDRIIEDESLHRTNKPVLPMGEFSTPVSNEFSPDDLV